jgi:hypothetical protein
MLSIPPETRAHVAGVDEDGHFFSNRQADFDEMSRNKPWKHLRDNMWIKPNDEIVALPDEPDESTERNAESVGCTPPPGAGTGAYVRGFSCGSTSKTFTTMVDSSMVGGSPGGSWCITPDANHKYGDTGYLLIGSAGQGATTDAGLQWSPTYKEYALYARQGKFADNIPTAMSLISSKFTMTLTLGPTAWTIYIKSSIGQKVMWMHMSGLPSTGNRFIYRQLTAIAQNPKTNSSVTGSYFGVAQGTSTPLFTWSTMDHFDSSPIDSSREIRSGNTYGINLHK